MPRGQGINLRLSVATYVHTRQWRVLSSYWQYCFLLHILLDQSFANCLWFLQWNKIPALWAGDKPRWIKVLTALSEDQRIVFPTPTPAGSQLPVTTDSWDLLSSSYLHGTGMYMPILTDTYTHTRKHTQLYFGKAVESIGKGTWIRLERWFIS